MENNEEKKENGASDEKVTLDKPMEEKRELLDSKTSDLKPAVQRASKGRIVMFYARMLGELKHLPQQDADYTAIVTRGCKDEGDMAVTLNVFTPYPSVPVIVVENVRHRSEILEAEVNEAYWDWPVITK